MSTQDNLQAAFAGESQANRKYLAFAAKADAEGFPQIAKLFRAAAAAETVHAHAHLRVMKGVGDTKQNLQAAIEGEGHEFQVMYPGFIQEAEAEGNKAALLSFRNANTVEKTHHDLYSKALETLQAGKDLTPAAIYVCDVCGHTHAGEAPDKCPVCGAPRTSSRQWPDDECVAPYPTSFLGPRLAQSRRRGRSVLRLACGSGLNERTTGTRTFSPGAWANGGGGYTAVVGRLTGRLKPVADRVPAEGRQECRQVEKEFAADGHRTPREAAPLIQPTTLVREDVPVPVSACVPAKTLSRAKSDTLLRRHTSASEILSQVKPILWAA